METDSPSVSRANFLINLYRRVSGRNVADPSDHSFESGINPWLAGSGDKIRNTFRSALGKTATVESEQPQE